MDGRDTQGIRRTLTVMEAGRILGISRGCAYEAARLGQIPTVRIGRRLLVPRAALARWEARKIGRATYITGASIERFVADLPKAQVRAS